MIIAGISFAIAGLGAAGDVVFTRPGPCAAKETYFLAENSAALIRVEELRNGASGDPVIVYRRPKPRDERGWASRRLLGHFDLSLGDGAPVIVNSGTFCRGPQ